MFHRAPVKSARRHSRRDARATDRRFRAAWSTILAHSCQRFRPLGGFDHVGNEGASHACRHLQKVKGAVVMRLNELHVRGAVGGAKRLQHPLIECE